VLMASNDSSNINSIRIETIVKKDSNKLSYEHEDIVKTHEMAAKKLSSSIDGKVRRREKDSERVKKRDRDRRGLRHDDD
jgi:hypothetical protein